MADEKDSAKSAIGDFYNKRNESNSEKRLDYTQQNKTVNTKVVLENRSEPVTPSFSRGNYGDYVTDEMLDSDLQVGFDTVQLPSKGIFYKNKFAELVVEYLTSKDEDILTTPALIENNTLIDVLLRAKIKTKGVNVDELLAGDKNAILLFLRASSYGKDYDVNVTDPFTGNVFKATIDLTRLKYKEIVAQPDENLCFTVELPMRKKWVKFRLVSDREIKQIHRQAESKKDASGQEFLELLSMRLKGSIVSIEGKTDRAYINKFVDAMPALDSLTLRRKIQEVTPDVDYSYEFVSPAGYTFTANVSIGVDFFFPKI